MREPEHRTRSATRNMSGEQRGETLNEAAIEPDLPIIDPHHHLRDRPDNDPRGAGHYLLPEFLFDIDCGHRIQATVAIECSAMYKSGGPSELRPVGETEFLNGVAAMSASGYYGPTQVCAGIVGFVDIRLGDQVRPVLEAHIKAGGGRFCGVRSEVSWDGQNFPQGLNAPHALLDPAVRRGVACLAEFNLSFDVHLHFTQLADLADLAQAVPQTTIILDHTGRPVHTGPDASRRTEVSAKWRHGMKELARFPNVVVKIGALRGAVADPDRPHDPRRPQSEYLASLWRPFIETCVELFGPDRCMFESNFPPDKKVCDYGVLWNAFKRVATQYNESEKLALFKGTATATYNLREV
jgi:L-fuconolactonase